MKKFNFLQIAFYLSLFVILTACGSSDKKQKEVDLKICPECHMELAKSNINTATIVQNDEKTYFDDVGCLVLYTHNNNIDLKKVSPKVFTYDSKRYIDAFKAHYTINENTPMHYGFGAYEKEMKNSIDFNKVILRMLRGENMANPKIRKQILGY